MKLTDYNTGNEVDVNIDRLVSVRQLRAEVFEFDGDIFELGQRTRLETEDGDEVTIFLVRETPKEIANHCQSND